MDRSGLSVIATFEPEASRNIGNSTCHARSFSDEASCLSSLPD